MKRLVLCVPTITKPYQQCLDAIRASEPLLKAAGWDSNMVSEIGSPYISSARSIMLRKALDFYTDVVVFIDHDLSWAPQDLLTLVETEGEVVAGTYRFKQDEVEYMGAVMNDIRGAPVVREDGCILAHNAPAGFLKMTRAGINRFIANYPELCYGERHAPHVDLFNHGAHDFVWYGEDYAFCRRWNERCGQMWIVPNLNITHHSADKSYPGNYHEYLLRQPGGSESANPIPPSERPLLKAA